jgi:NAD kinase
MSVPLHYAEEASVWCLGHGQVVSFNMGSLGFLTNHQFSDFKADLAGVMAGTEALEECSPEGATVRPFPQEK